MRSRLILSTTILLTTHLFSQEIAAQDADDAEQKLRDARHAMFLQTVSGLNIEYSDEAEKLRLIKTPLLRYYNPVRGRFNDGEMFAFTDDSGIPQLIVASSIRANGRLFVEAASISNKSFSGKLPGFGAWRPEFGGSGMILSELQPKGATTPQRRLLAMRKIAKSVSFKFKKKEWSSARLLTQPVHRYQAPQSGRTDGAIFAYGESNDPEALLHVWHETSEDNPDGKWYLLAAASTSLPIRCEQNDSVIWRRKGYWSSPRRPNVSYVESLVGNHPELVTQKQPKN